MKQRVISSLVGLAILFAVLVFFDTLVLNVAVSIVIVMQIFELLTAAGYHKTSASSLSAFAFGSLIPFFQTSAIANVLPVVCFCFALILVCALLKDHETLRVEQVAAIFFFTIAIAFSGSCFVFMRDVMGSTVGMYGIFVGLVGAWMSDTGAYFVGTSFGKRKLAPKISPKKTLEGAIGGVIISTVSQVAMALIYIQVMDIFFGLEVTIRFLPLILISPILSVLSVVGDLTFSIIKRQFNLKDFGNIMPGHGGALDRFDSLILIMPLVYILFRYLPLLEVL